MLPLLILPGYDTSQKNMIQNNNNKNKNINKAHQKKKKKE